MTPIQTPILANPVPDTDEAVHAALLEKRKFNRVQYAELSRTGPRSELIACEMEHDRLTVALAYYERILGDDEPAPTDVLLDKVTAPVKWDFGDMINRDEISDGHE